MKAQTLHKTLLSLIGLVVMLLFAACSGVGTTSGNTLTISGTIQSVDAAHHSVTISSNGQTYTITGLSDQTLQALQSQVGKTYTLQVTQNSDGSYALTAGTQPTPGTTGGTTSGGPSVNGSISFTGSVQSASNSSLTVKLPDGSNLAMVLNTTTDLSDMNGAPFSSGQMVKVEASTNADGSFTATKVKHADAGDSDANTVDFQGATTQTVGSDNVLHFGVGKQRYSYTISSTAEVKDFSNAQAIPNGASIKVEVQFTGATGNVTKISNVND